MNSTDPSIVPNNGLRVNITAFDSSTLPPDSSLQVASEEAIGPFEAVMGIFENTGNLPTAFFSVFTNRTDQTAHLSYWPSFPLVPGQSYDFSIVPTNGTNWTVELNGQLFGGNRSAATFDFGATNATWFTSVGFSEIAIYLSGTTVPPLVTIPLALAVRHGANWDLPSDARASFLGSAGAQWGVEGRAQRSNLAPGELLTGTGIANVTNGTVLWTGGIVPVLVGITFDTAMFTSTVPSIARVEVTDTLGAGIGGVALFVHDSLGGLFNPPDMTTNASGGAASLYETPNVTARSMDLVSVSVTLFGYSGAAAQSLPIDPATQILLVSSPDSPSVAPGGVIDLSYTATDTAGVPVPQLFLSFSVVGAASLTPNFGATDPNGSVVVQLQAPSAVGTVVVSASVASLGFWGHRTTSVAVVIPAPTFWRQYGTEIGDAAGVALLVGVVALVYLLLRRGRKRIPEMKLRTYLKESEDRQSAVRSTTDGRGAVPESGPSRTPPSSGTP